CRCYDNSKAHACSGPADWKSAIQQVGNLRYSSKGSQCLGTKMFAKIADFCLYYPASQRTPQIEALPAITDRETAKVAGSRCRETLWWIAARKFRLCLLSGSSPRTRLLSAPRKSPVPAFSSRTSD